ncbi:MAG: EAL domain-containing protein [Actinomycetota bacterium]
MRFQKHDVVENVAPEESALARAILKLAQTFHLEAVAEGVERKGQLDALRKMGCVHAQGFYFAEPRPLEDLRSMLIGSLSIARA